MKRANPAKNARSILTIHLLLNYFTFISASESSACIDVQRVRHAERIFESQDSPNIFERHTVITYCSLLDGL